MKQRYTLCEPHEQEAFAKMKEDDLPKGVTYEIVEGVKLYVRRIKTLEIRGFMLFAISHSLLCLTAVISYFTWLIISLFS